MAERDRSQGIGFVYSDISTLLKESKQWDDNAAQPVHFETVSEKDSVTLTKPTAPNSSNDESIRQIKGNLERLQGLHHKLHAILGELSDLSNKKKK